MANIKALLLVGGPYHDNPGMREALVEAIGAYGEADVAVTDDRSVLASPALAEHDALMVYTTGGTLTEAEAAGLAGFVAGGKGFVGIHGATTSFKESPSYVALLGATFVKHPPFTDVAVKIVDADHPITRGLGDFVVPDELYILDCDPSQLHVLATAQVGDEVQPSAYVKTWGQGRVFYLALGHDERCLRSEGFRTLVGRGLRWSVGRL